MLSVETATSILKQVLASFSMCKAKQNNINKSREFSEHILNSFFRIAPEPICPVKLSGGAY